MPGNVLVAEDIMETRCSQCPHSLVREGNEKHGIRYKDSNKRGSQKPEKVVAGNKIGW